MSDVCAWLASLSPQKRDYALKHTPSHLAKAGKVQQLFRCLTNFDFIEAKVSALGVQPLIEDYDLAFNPDVLFSGEKADTLRWIQGALRLSAHILDQDKTQLAGQLLGRLMSFEVPEIKRLLEQVRQGQSAPWLRTLTPSLRQAGEPLLQTLAGHLASVKAIAVIAEGQRAISASSDYDLKIWDLKSGTELLTLEGHTQGIWAMAVTPNGQKAISTSQDKTLKVWDLEHGAELRTLWIGDLSKAVAVTPDGHRAICSDGCDLKVWDLERGAELQTLEGHIESIQAVTVTPDGKQALSGSSDFTIKFGTWRAGQNCIHWRVILTRSKP
jgi:hypothetical protein